MARIARPGLAYVAVAFVTNFFDTLGRAHERTTEQDHPSSDSQARTGSRQ
jgi:hypothetical protein